jgi:SAM-dependent methyltransferase
MRDQAVPTHGRRRLPNTAADPATLTREEYVRLQVERSRLKLGEDCSARALLLLERLRDAVGHREYRGLRRILCVGCRNGFELTAAELAGFGDVIGIDLHSCDPRILVMDMHEMSFDDGEFDVVLASHSLEHARDPGAAGAELRRVTRVGGYIVVEVPIFYGTRGADLWDFESPGRVAELLGRVETVWTEEAMQLDGPQEVARVIARAVVRGA